MLLADPHELIPTNTDPSAIPTFNTVDEHDGAIVAMLVTKTYLFTCSTDCTCAVYSLDMLTRPKVILIGHSEVFGVWGVCMLAVGLELGTKVSCLVGYCAAA